MSDNETSTETEEEKIQKIVNFIRETINKSMDEAEAISAIIKDVDGATFKGCRSNGQSGSLTFVIEIEGFGSTRKISVKRRFH